MIEFDENIEFKPLSDGLGFHPKKGTSPVNSQKPVHAATKPTATQSPSAATRPSASAYSAKPVNSNPLHKPTNKESDVITPAPVWMQPVSERFNPWAGDLDIGREPTVDGMVEGGMENSTVIENPFFVPSKVSSPVEVVTLRFSGYDGLKKKKVKPVTGSFTAIMMDVLMIISISMIFLTFVLSIMGESITAVLQQLPQDAAQRSSLFGILVSLGFLYLVFSRCMFGRTLGEWMMRMQLGSNEDQAMASYSVKVLFRTSVVFLTGLFVFPLLSWLSGKDLLSYFSGLEMHAEVSPYSKK